ncbi:MAG: DUF2232 domain-containing protein [Coprobacillus sp.]|nr:DUF2232 domain-containing protein [Coprobacillus sp.]
MPFKKRETLVQNMTYMAIMAAINVVFVLLTTFVPVLMFLMVFILPLTSTMVALYCKKKYFIIYALVTVGLCMLVTMYNISDTLFYVIPSVITGFIFGFMVEKKIHAVWIIFTTSVIQLVLSYLMLPVIYFWLGIDMVNVFASVFGLADYEYLAYLVPSFIYFLALGQEAISYIVIKGQLPKFNYNVTTENKFIYTPYIGALLSFTFSIVFAFIYGPVAYLFMMFAAYFTIFIVASSAYRDGMKAWISLPIAFIVSIFIFAWLYSYIPDPLGLLAVEVMFGLVSITALVNDLLTTKAKIAPRVKEELENKYFD